MGKISNDICAEIICKTDIARVRSDPYERRMYSHDLASLPKMMELGFKMMPDLVVKPTNSEEIVEIVKIAMKESIPIIPRGGASWGLGGAMPVEGGIVIDLTRMDNILKIDEDNLIVTVETGISWKSLFDQLMKKGYLIGSYPSSAFAATVGGWINTGGVGVGSYKYGSAVNMVRSMEIVLPTGRMIKIGTDEAINYGSYDMNKLFFGSEGTLGIVTKVNLKIYPAPEEIRPLSYEFSDLTHLSEAVRAVTRSEIVPLHMAFLDKNHFELLKEIGMSDHTLKGGGMLNMALEGDKAVLDVEETVLNGIVAHHNGVAQSRETSKHEWDERFYELRTKRAGPSAVLGEAFVPVSNMSSMIHAIYKLIKKMKLRAAITGMMGDRNTVVFMPYYLSDERKMIRSMASLSFVKKLGDLAFKHNGRPAGIGLFFSGNIRKMYGHGHDVMNDIKDVMDPYDIMNPGKTTEGLTRFGVPIPPIAINSGMNVMAQLKHMMTKDKKVIT